MMKKQKSISSPERETFLSTFFRAVCKMDKNLTCYCNIFILFSAMWVEHSQNAIIGSKLRSIRSPSSSCVAALESKEIGMEWSKWHTWATLPIFKNFMQWISKLLFPKKYFKKCTSLSHFKNSHKYQISHFYQLWNFKIGFQFHILNISKYKDNSAIYLKYDGNIIIQNSTPNP